MERKNMVCEVCHWWKKCKRDMVTGECCFNPPVAIADGYETGGPAPTTVWPETNQDDHCHEFSPKK